MSLKCQLCNKGTMYRHLGTIPKVCKRCEIDITWEHKNLMSKARWDRLVKFQQLYPHLFMEHYRAFNGELDKLENFMI